VFSKSCLARRVLLICGSSQHLLISCSAVSTALVSGLYRFGQRSLSAVVFVSGLYRFCQRYLPLLSAVSTALVSGLYRSCQRSAVSTALVSGLVSGIYRFVVFVSVHLPSFHAVAAS
jgi:hypothetical protein